MLRLYALLIVLLVRVQQCLKRDIFYELTHCAFYVSLGLSFFQEMWGEKDKYLLYSSH